ncbi:hypothetical protein BSPWISOXPB_11386 [uncultured Gammaproteobacteria bacterium]|nr:hypothetical protein BSPWISOXPB_11386 [uncultured Gammaproteobacteria bacterium]
MHTDALGNIVTVTGNNGEIRLRQATSPFGETITQGLVDNLQQVTSKKMI